MDNIMYMKVNLFKNIGMKFYLKLLKTSYTFKRESQFVNKNSRKYNFHAVGKTLFNCN